MKTLTSKIIQKFEKSTCKGIEDDYNNSCVKKTLATPMRIYTQKSMVTYENSHRAIYTNKSRKSRLNIQTIPG